MDIWLYRLNSNMSIALWAVSWAFFRENPVSLKDMDFSEIYIIEQIAHEEKDLAIMNPEAMPWWRKWLV